MNGALIHLGLNHYPIVLVSVGVGFAFLGWIGKKEFLKRVGLTLFVLAGLFGLPAYFSGEGAEEVIEKSLSGSGALIHEHEEWAEKTIILVELLAVLSAGLLWACAKSKKIQKSFWVALGALSLLACGSLMLTAHYGGLIHHDEIRGGVLSPKFDSSEKNHD